MSFAAHAAHLALAQIDQIFSFEQDLSGGYFSRGLGDQSQNRKRRDALAAAALADQADRLALPDVEADAVYCAQLTVVGVKRGDEISHLEKRRGFRHGRDDTLAASVSPSALRAAPFVFLSYGLAAAACAKSPANPAKSATPIASASSSAEPRVERIVVSADEIATIASGTSDHAGAMPAVFILGRADENARLFLRFTLHLPKNGVLRSANLLLSRTDDVDMTPDPIELHATRVVEAWEARSISWPFQPRIEEVRAPHTTVSSAGAKIVRVDVRSIVSDWPLRDPNDQGIAVVSDRTSTTGTSFAYMSRDARPPELEIFGHFPAMRP